MVLSYKHLYFLEIYNGVNLLTPVILYKSSNGVTTDLYLFNTFTVVIVQ